MMHCIGRSTAQQSGSAAGADYITSYPKAHYLSVDRAGASLERTMHEPEWSMWRHISQLHIGPGGLYQTLELEAAKLVLHEHQLPHRSCDNEKSQHGSRRQSSQQT
eukprot:4256743-Amphidinium_carterae.1